MKRRTLLGAAAATSLLPGISRAQGSRVLRFVPQSNVTSIDPVWTTANVTRNHGYMVYDTLYAMDGALSPQPQMVAGHVVEADGSSWTLTLREGLVFHDGTPVRAADVVASIRRWQQRNPFGAQLASVTDELAVLDDRRLRFRLKRPFPLVAHALGGASSPCFVMPERIAATDPYKQITDATGSGPFRFKADEYNSGSLIVYERAAHYLPRPTGVPSLYAGPKIVHLDRVEWHVITDGATAAAALQHGEIDWYEQPSPELQTLLARDRQIVVEPADRFGLLGVMRFNFLHPPFDDPALRRALLPAIDQADYMMAIVGTDPADRREGVGVFTPGSAMASDAGMAPLLDPRSLERARSAMAQAGYHGARMRLIGPTDILAPTALTQVAADMFQRLGFNVDVALSDWGTVIQRRNSREPVDKGGWSVFLTSFNGFDFVDPGAHPVLRGNGVAAWNGWPTLPRLEQLRTKWFEATDPATSKALAEDIQREVLEQVAFIPLGGYVSKTAFRRELSGRVAGPPMFWNLQRAG